MRVSEIVDESRMHANCDALGGFYCKNSRFARPPRLIRILNTQAENTLSNLDVTHCITPFNECGLVQMIFCCCCCNSLFLLLCFSVFSCLPSHSLWVALSRGLCVHWNVSQFIIIATIKSWSLNSYCLIYPVSCVVLFSFFRM